MDINILGVDRSKMSSPWINSRPDSWEKENMNSLIFPGCMDELTLEARGLKPIFDALQYLDVTFPMLRPLQDVPQNLDAVVK